MSKFKSVGIGMVVVGVLMSAMGAWASTAGSDDASNYTNWTNGINAGTGFGPWALDTWQQYAGHFIGSSTNAGTNMNIDVSGKAFGMYANPPESNSYANSTRYFAGGALTEGQTFSAKIGVNFWNGNKGIDIYAVGGAKLLNLNFSDDNGGIKLEYGSPTTTNFMKWENTGAGYNYTLNITKKSGNIIGFQLSRSYDSSNFVADLTLTGVPGGFHFYTGRTSSSPQSDFFFNSLSITDSGAPALSINGQKGMVSNHTNAMSVIRGGSTNSALTVNLNSSATGVATVPASVEIPAGSVSAAFNVAGVGAGSATITASAAGYTTSQLAVAVFNVAYDDSSYYGATEWTNESNGGVGFSAWTNNSSGGVGEGYTNHTGNFLGNSAEAGGGNVNASSNNAFALYANKEGSSGPAPEFNTSRPFADLAIGDKLSVDLGVKWRNGAKGVVLQHADAWLFEVAVIDNDYVYQNHFGGSRTSLGWGTYADNTSIRLELQRVADSAYNITIIRSGDLHATNVLQNVNLGGVPNLARFYVYNTEGGTDNNLYFNSLAINSEAVPQFLQVSGPANVNLGGTTELTVTRSVPTNTALTVNLASSAPGVASVPASVQILADEASATFNVTGVSSGTVEVSVSATGFTGASQGMKAFTFPAEFDDAGNYSSALFTNGANRGAGFGAWGFSALSGGGTISLRDSTTGSGPMNSYNNLAFSMLGGSDNSYAEATRTLNTGLAEGDQLAATLGVNWSDGNRGMDVKSGDGATQLFNFNVGGDPIAYVYGFGGEAGVNLGWPYSGTSVVRVTVSQLSGNQLQVALTRNDGLTTNVTSSGLTVSAGQVKFYNGGHGGGNANLALFVNDLLITRGTGGDTTDGIPNSWWDRYGITGPNRVAANDADSDTSPNLDEYIADTNPTNKLSVFICRITNAVKPRVTTTLQVGPPTTNSRVYDVWFKTNLVNNSNWTPLGLNISGAANGSAVSFTVTNTDPKRIYRTGVKLP